MMAGTILSGMKAIQEGCRAMNLPSTEVTVLKMIRESDFPARKIGGIWVATRENIEEWVKKITSSEDPAAGKPKKKKNDPRRRW